MLTDCPKPLAMAIDGLVLRDCSESKHGPKRSLLTTEAGERVHKMFRQPTTSPYGPSSYDRESSESRQSIAVLVTDELSDQFLALDQWAKAYVEEHSGRLLGKKLNKQQVDKAYVSCIKKRADGPELLRLKMNMAEPKPCRFWSPAKEEVEPPTSWEDQPVQLRILFSHIWVMGAGAQCEFGLVCLVTDAMVMQRSRVCPDFDFD